MENTSEQLRDHHRSVPSWIWLILTGVLIFNTAVRLRLLSAPLERDEGEYAYAGQLILQGTPPYEEVYNMKLPGIYAVYAAILAVFGQTRQAIHFGLLIVNTATIAFVFLLVRRLLNNVGAVLSAAIFMILTLSSSMQGIYANAEHFVLLPAIAGLWMLINAIDKKNRWWLMGAGLSMGTSFIIKQHGAAFVLLGFVYYAITLFRQKPFHLKKSLISLLILGAGMAAPFALTCLILFLCGVFDQFWFWTFSYAREYISYRPLPVGLKLLIHRIKFLSQNALLLWLLVPVGIICVLGRLNNFKKKTFLLSFLFFSFLSICPGFYFRLHYFILLTPAISIFIAIGMQLLFQFNLRKKICIIATIMIACGAFFETIYKQRDYLFRQSPAEVTRSIYYGNPFVESLEIAEYLQAHTDPDERIAVVGSEPQLFFYAKRRSVSPYIYMYSLMEEHPFALKMQTEFISHIEAYQPKYMVFVWTPTSWLFLEKSQTLLIDWFQSYNTRYRVVGLVEIYPGQPHKSYWGSTLQRVQRQSDFFVTVLERLPKSNNR